jgi:hypothetical protein
MNHPDAPDWSVAFARDIDARGWAVTGLVVPRDELEGLAADPALNWSGTGRSEFRCDRNSIAGVATPVD